MTLDEPEVAAAKVSERQTECSICKCRVGTDGDKRMLSQRRIAELLCGHRFCEGFLKRQVISRERRCSLCRAKSASEVLRRCSQQEAARMRAVRRQALLKADGSARFETLVYDVGYESEDDNPPLCQ